MKDKDDDEKPKPTGKVTEVKLTDAIVPATKDGLPCIVSVDGVDEHYILVFSHGEEYMEAFMTDANLPYNKPVRITEEKIFLETLPKDIRIAVNPYMHKGRVRWGEIVR